MSDKLLRAMDRISQAQRRKWLRQQIADALRVATAAKAAGFPVRSWTIAGVRYELGEPPKAALDKTIDTPDELRRLI
jgi:methylphosphotriester-DNA--protein-cysteine methyltransferase